MTTGTLPILTEFNWFTYFTFKSLNSIAKTKTKNWKRTHFVVELPIHPAFVLNDQVSDQVISILTYCKIPKSKQEILTFLGLKNHNDNYKRHVEPLIEKNYLDYTIKENLKDRNQKYVTTLLGISIATK